jgi:Thioesterase-like superfamily
MPDAFYEPLDDEGRRWRATAHTSGPWDPGAQHGGPPSALLGRAMERCAPREEMTFVRVTCEILGAVPVGELEVSARVVRPGRSVELVEAVLSAGGRDAVRASGWRVLRTDAAAVPSRLAPAPPLPDAAVDLDGTAWTGGYLRAVEWRLARGAFTEPGPATAWTRLRHPLVPDEEPSPLVRVLAVADSGNGLSGELDLTQWHFINPELTVHLSREAVGEWVCLDASTTISPGGAGLATSVLSDRVGPVGVGAQSLLVARRPGEVAAG